MRTCKVFGCGNKSSKGNGISFFTMPGEDEIRNEWLEFLFMSGVRQLKDLKNFYICENHFEKKFIQSGYKTNRKQLMAFAVPTILPNGDVIESEYLTVNTFHAPSASISNSTHYPATMKKCRVHGCPNDSSKGFSLFKLPSIKEKRDKWMQFLITSGRNIKCGIEHYLICEEHFEKRYILVNEKGNRKHITWDAVPTIFPAGFTPPKTSTLLPSQSTSKAADTQDQPGPSTSQNPLEPPIPKCAVKSCRATYKDLFLSPEDPVKLMKWKVAVNTNESEFYVCEIHFTQNDLIIEKNLEDNAVPKLFLSNDNLNLSASKCCGICLEGFQHGSKIYKVTDINYETFLNASGYRPLSSHMCQLCKDALDRYKKFQTEIQVKHEKARIQAKKPEITIKPIDIDDDQKKLVTEVFKCEKCPFTTSNSETLTKHMTNLHFNTKLISQILPKVFKCPKCHRKFDNKVRFNWHITEGHKPEKVTCFFCKDTFKSDHDLRIHELIKHKKHPQTADAIQIPKSTIVQPSSSLKISNVFGLTSANKTLINRDENYEIEAIYEIRELEEIPQNIESVEEITIVENPSNLDLKDENETESDIVKITEINQVKEAPKPSNQKPQQKKLSLYELRKQRLEKALPEIQIESSKYKCLDCDEIFTSTTKLIRHRILIHPDKVERNKIITEKLGRKVKCEICGEEVLDVNLDDHKAKNHSTSSFLCHVCSESFTSQDSLDLHLMTHEDFSSSSLICDLCGKKKATKFLMKAHMENIHLKTEKSRGEMQQCKICYKIFFNQEKLEMHMERLHMDGYDCGARCNTETNTYHCEKCGASFFSLLTLRVHEC